jgi:hypothetical protein
MTKITRYLLLALTVYIMSSFTASFSSGKNEQFSDGKGKYVYFRIVEAHTSEQPAIYYYSSLVFVPGEGRVFIENKDEYAEKFVDLLNSQYGKDYRVNGSTPTWYEEGTDEKEAKRYRKERIGDMKNTKIIEL